MKRNGTEAILRDIEKQCWAKRLNLFKSTRKLNGINGDEVHLVFVSPVSNARPGNNGKAGNCGASSLTNDCYEFRKDFTLIL